MTAPAIQIFSSSEERAHHAATLAFVVLVSLELALPKWVGVQPLLQDNFGEIAFFIGLFLFETLHVALTYLGLAFVPELRDWSTRKTRANPTVQWAVSIAAIVLMTLALYFSNGFLLNSNSSNVATQLVATFLLLMTLHHRVLQTQGLSLAYSQASPTSRERDRHVEKAAFRLFFFLNAATYLLFFRHLLLTKKLGAPDVVLAHLQDFLAGGAFLVGLFLIARAIRASKRNDAAARPKALHLVRTLFYPLVPYSLFAIIAVQSLHGLEYTLLWKKLGRAAQVKKPARRSAAIAATFVLIFYIITYAGSLAYWGQTNIHLDVLPNWLRLALSVSTAITVWHFLLDRAIFRMRDPLTREILGPLLVSKR